MLSRVGLAARLSKIEYRNSVADVIGVDLLPAELDAAAGGIPDDSGDGVLKHLADKQTSVEQHPLAYFQVADGVAKRADMTALSTRLGNCSNATADCGTAFARALGRRLFRRPLDQRETTPCSSSTTRRWAKSWYSPTRPAGCYAHCCKRRSSCFGWHRRSPAPGQQRDLDGYELAAALSSFLWVSVPDDELLTAAGNGTLVRPESSTRR